MREIYINKLEKYVPVIVFLLVFLAFLPSLFNGFVDWDDLPNVINNNGIRGLTLANIKWMFTTFYMSHYIPLSWFSLAIDWSIWKLNPFGYHFTNVFLHAGSAAFIAAISIDFFNRNKLKKSAAIFGSIVAAILFAVHPLRVESVSWITERRDVLSAFFFLLAVLVYIKSFTYEGVKKNSLVLVFILYITACLAKSMAVTLPAVLLLCDFYPLRRLPVNFKQIFKKENMGVLIEKIPFFIFAFFLSSFYYFIVGKAIDVPYINAYMPSAAKAVYAYWFYLVKSILPFNLSPVYVAPQNYLLPNLLGLLFIAAIIILAFHWRKKYPSLLAAFLFYAGTLFPVCGLINGAPVPAADRYCYIPCIGFAVLFGGLAAKFYEKSSVRTVVFSCLLILLLEILCIKQQFIWHGSTSVWTYVAKVQPRSAIARNNLASLTFAKGNKVLAEKLMNEAIELAPEDFNIHFNCANLYEMLGNNQRALEEYTKVVNSAPNYYTAYVKKGLTEKKLNLVSVAEKSLLEASQLRPHYAEAWRELAVLKLEESKYTQAEKYALNLVKIEKSDISYLILAAASVGQKKYKEAATLCAEAIKLNLQNLEAAECSKRLNTFLKNK